MGRKPNRDHVFVETDGQVYLVRDRGTLRFPRVGETLPFRTEPNGVMDFGDYRVLREKPLLDHHPDEWFGRDAIFQRSDVDPLVKRAIDSTMIRSVPPETGRDRGCCVVHSRQGAHPHPQSVRELTLVDFFLQSNEARAAMEVKRHGLAPHASRSNSPTVFLDRDGVINRGRPGYVRTPDQFQFLPGAMDGMRLLQDRGWHLVIVTNQDAAGWKLLPEPQLAKVHDRMLAALDKEGVHVAEIYYCPHNVLSDCACRKPRPGMLLAAARNLCVRPRGAWMVGDKPSDVETGRAFGCRTAWVGPKSWRKRFAAEVRPLSPDVVADGLLDAARAIVRYSEDPVAEAARKSVADPTITS